MEVLKNITRKRMQALSKLKVLIAFLYICLFFIISKVRLRKQNVVLQHENDIKENADKTQPKFDRIPCDPPPVAGCVAIKNQLQHRQQPPEGVQEDVPNAPARGRAPPVVEVRLGDVLHDGDGHLHVREEVEPAQPGEAPPQEQHPAGVPCDAQEAYAKKKAADPARSGLVAIIVAHLHDRDHCNDQSMHRKANIVQGHLVVISVMGFSVLILNGRDEVKAQIEHRVSEKAKEVVGFKIKAEPPCAFPTPIQPYLRVKADAPRDKICVANNV
mmetsp:Transcript_3375/g.5339  ORF Transcript_3375/g.5339 Transcript_3375/m.5339 type:complete len:272 (+) Transcript_3375:242-1057(+)